MENKKVFHVSRSTKTGKSVSVGDFDTVEQAKEAMLEHYKKTPKRGKFRYSISEQDLETVNGIVFRKLCMVLSSGSKPFFKYFTADELKDLAG